jgi:hypothetical protein
MTTLKTIAIALAGLAVIGTAVATATRPIDYCDINKCPPCPTGGCPTSESINFCCSPSGVCVQTELLGDCDPDDIAAVCECGQSNADGSITCWDC